jgi:hypothetical protein
MQQVICGAPGADADHGYDSWPTIGAALADPIKEAHCPKGDGKADDQREFSHGD